VEPEEKEEEEEEEDEEEDEEEKELLVWEVNAKLMKVIHRGASMTVHCCRCWRKKKNWRRRKKS
jgi:ornithine carbamoyltransferase